jgi:hypothetical protein
MLTRVRRIRGQIEAIDVLALGTVAGSRAGGAKTASLTESGAGQSADYPGVPGTSKEVGMTSLAGDCMSTVCCALLFARKFMLRDAAVYCA